MCFVGVLSCRYGFAQDPDSLFLQGNTHYRNAAFAEAVDCYEALRKAQWESPSLYYNLANSYFKLNKISLAILNYERVLLIDPGHKDAKFNLSLANEQIVDKIEAINEQFGRRLYVNLLSFYSADTWAKISISCFIVALLALFLYFFGKRVGQKKAGFFIGVLCFLFSISGFWLAHLSQARLTAADLAIVFAPSVTVKSNPTAVSTDLFILHEGTKVKILNQDGAWRQVQLVDRSEGWLKVEDIEIINN